MDIIDRVMSMIGGASGAGIIIATGRDGLNCRSQKTEVYWSPAASVCS